MIGATHSTDRLNELDGLRGRVNSFLTKIYVIINMSRWSRWQRYAISKSLGFIVITHIGKKISLRRPLNFISPSCTNKDWSPSCRPSRRVLAMSTQYFYAVRKGKKPGVYRTW